MRSYLRRLERQLRRLRALRSSADGSGGGGEEDAGRGPRAETAAVGQRVFARPAEAAAVTDVDPPAAAPGVIRSVRQPSGLPGGMRDAAADHPGPDGAVRVVS